MVTLRINELDVTLEEGTTLLEAAQFLGIEIPTLCYDDGLSPYGACRLCVVEIGKEPKTRLVSACTYPVEEGLVVRTHSTRVLQARKMLVELMVSIAPRSKTLQDLAAQLGVQQVRFETRDEECILCGLCVRICKEQMQSGAIGFAERGYRRRITTPFDRKSEICRTCGACIYICPVCQLRCQGPKPPTAICGSCLQLSPSCAEVYDDLMCYMGPAGVCGTCVKAPNK
ncbi:MAG: 2Fe-2S iron-sulfur cluster-binding protein [Candidatus Bipolaricaulota bacterium]|nr:2Fe-2S iron-sulfur cluster-binding protein [Candidatus Bipolaricaulota bacterium]MDW8140819.1 2Fe-2S iron-sulfur cluster-binding protein [Candidatus Bipolaricaulota bacterium]